MNEGGGHGHVAEAAEDRRPCRAQRTPAAPLGVAPWLDRWGDAAAGALIVSVGAAMAVLGW